MSTELVPFEFHGDVLQTALEDNSPMVAFKPLVTVMGLDYPTQLSKLRTRSWATVGLSPTVAADGKMRKVVMIDMRTLSMWLATINENNVAEAARAKLITYQAKCADALEEYWSGKRRAVLPQDYVSALKALVASEEAKIEAQEQLAIAAPVVDAYTAHVSADGGITIRDLCKQLANDGYKVNTRTIFTILHDIGIIYRQGETWSPFETARRDGLAISRIDLCNDGRNRAVALITPKGVLEIRSRLAHLR